MAHHERPEHQQPARHQHRQSRDAHDEQAHDALEVVVAAPRLELRQMRQQRGLDGHEQLQRRARDQQHVEDDAGEDLVVRDELHAHNRRVQQHLLGQHDARDRDRELGRRLGSPLRDHDRFVASIGSAHAERDRQHHERHERRHRDTRCDGGLTMQQADGNRQRERAA
jgi:hypothetical protein